MPDGPSRRLDAEILRFMKKYARSSEAPDAAFNALALKLFEHQFRMNRAYRRFCALENKSPSNVKHWKDIPAMPALGFKELVLASFPPMKRVRVFHTSGTTHETKGAHFFDTLALYRHSLTAGFERFMLAPSATKKPADGAFSFYFLMPSAENAPYSSLSYMMGEVNRRFARGRGRFFVKKGLPKYADLAGALKKEKKKILLCATAFALKGFLDHLKDKKTALRLPAGSRLMETGGFKGRTKEISKERLYSECTERLGIPRKECVSEYGMTELSSQMYAAALGDFRGPAWLRTVVIDPGTGKEAKKGTAGLLRHVDLANRGSVIAVQTEDLGRRTASGLRLLGRATDAEVRGCSLHYEEFVREGI